MYCKKQTLFIFFILLIPCIFTVNVKGDGIDNPNGDGNWKLNDMSLTIMYEYQGELIDMHPNEVQRDLSPGETRIRDSYHGNLSIEIFDEHPNWAKLQIKLNDLKNSYGKQAERIDNKSFNLTIDKSNNIAYHEETGEKIGYCPFYYYAYNQVNFLDGKREKDVNLDKMYKFIYMDGCSIETIQKGSSNRKTFSIDEPLLEGSSKEKINYTSISQYEGGVSQNRNEAKIRFTGKGSYPVNIDCYLPAEIFIDHPVNESYIRMKATLGYNQDNAVEYLKSLELKKLDNKDPVPKMLFVFIGTIISLGAVLGYVAYKKQR
ncbi:MAG: hypothetical protein R6W73_06215 [Candidatus Saliniplasma sp.]